MNRDSIDSLPVGDELKRRIRIALDCHDCDPIPKVEGAGQVFDAGEGRYQLMHNGVKVVEGGYYGQWMAELIKQLEGHHEPQEEFVFYEILKHIENDRPAAPTMLELGAFWSYYSLWFHQQLENAQNYMIEPDPSNIDVGMANFKLNGFEGTFTQAALGERSIASVPFVCESDGRIRPTPVVAIDDYLAENGIDFVDLILSDIQGFEKDMLEGARRSIQGGKVRFMLISTHHHSISNDPLTHQACLECLRAMGARILAEHNVSDSYSGDGLIAAAFLDRDESLPTIPISRNQPSNSLFGELEYDLDKALKELAAIKSGESAQKFSFRRALRAVGRRLG